MTRGSSPIRAATTCSGIRDVVCGWREALPTDGAGWLVAFDPGFATDPAAVAVVGRDPFDGTLLRAGHVQRWLPPKRKRGRYRTKEEADRVIETVLDDVAAIAARFQARVVSDQHLPGVVISELGKRGVGVTIRP